MSTSARASSTRYVCLRGVVCSYILIHLLSFCPPNPHPSKLIKNPTLNPLPQNPPRNNNQYALDTMPRDRIPELYADFVQFEKKHGDRAAIEVISAWLCCVLFDVCFV